MLVTGSGVQWSEADKEMLAFVEAAGIPFYTTPQGRGVIPEDHEYSYLTARAAAFQDADLILVVGTRMNYVIGNAAPPRWNAAAKIVRIDIDPVRDRVLAAQASTSACVADAKVAFSQLTEAIKGKVDAGAATRRGASGCAPATCRRWRRPSSRSPTTSRPSIRLRLCKEVRDFIDRDCVLCVDGQEILNYGRQAIPQFTARHRINSGAFGTMGVGMPFGVGAKVGQARQAGDRAARRRLVGHERHGVRHGHASQPAGACRSSARTAAGRAIPNKEKPGRDLGYPRYDKFAECFGGHGEYVEKPEDIRPALERAKKAVAAGKSAIVTVVTDWKARATTTAFTRYST